MNIPKHEIQEIADAIRMHPEYLDTDFIAKKYSSLDIELICDPFSPKITELVIEALQNQTGYSVIRMGDGELNILAYQKYHNTPTLDRLSFEKILSMQQDTFIPSTKHLFLLQDLMLGAVVTADIIGVIGLWRPRQPTTDSLLDALQRDIRGISGHWRALDYMLRLAKQGYFTNKILASAHLYLSVLDNLTKLLATAQKVLLISNRQDVGINLSNKFPSINIEFLPVGYNQHIENKILKHPFFLSEIYNALPDKMNGYLCLIGAGPWSEIYCSWIKERNGVAIDIGSGFDLLDGKQTRRVHQLIGNQALNKYIL